jgi:hypothetical protein
VTPTLKATSKAMLNYSEIVTPTARLMEIGLMMATQTLTGNDWRSAMSRRLGSRCSMVIQREKYWPTG